MDPYGQIGYILVCKGQFMEMLPKVLNDPARNSPDIMSIPKGQNTKHKTQRNYWGRTSSNWASVRVSRSQISFVIDEEGQVKLFPLNFPAQELSGIFHRTDIKKVTQEGMASSISKSANDWT